MSFILLSLLLWWFLAILSYKNPIQLNCNSRGGGGGTSEITSHTYYYYRIRFPDTNIDPSQPIILYNAFATASRTIPPYYEFMNYGEGILSIPGQEQNSEIESVATATYSVFYSSGDLVIDYDNAEFKIAKRLIRSVTESLVSATFQYIAVFTPVRDVASVIDGRWDTQVQTEFYAKPPNGYNYAILDLGASYSIQALDLVAGFYKPDEDGARKFDVGMTLTLKYSLNGTDYYDISDETNSFTMSGGESKSFEESDLGVEFQARYLKLILEDVDKLDYGQVKDSNGTVLREGIYVVAFTEISAYNNIILKSESSLISTTYLASAIDLGVLSSAEYPTTITVDSTSGFELESGETTRTAYIENSDGTFDTFTYTGTTSTSFTGVSGLSSSHSIDDMVVQSVETDTTLYDYDGLLPKLKDRIYKKTNISDEYLYTQTQLDYLAKRYLKEFYKNHTKRTVEVLYAPHLKVGDTIKLVDTYNNENTLYFIEAIRDNSGYFTITLARYP